MRLKRVISHEIAGRNRTEEVQKGVCAMTLRTIAIRVEPELHTQLTLLAQLSGRPLVEEIREAIDEHIARKGNDVDLTAQAQAALEEIDRDATSRRQAIESLLKSKTQGATRGKAGKGNTK